MIDLEKLITDVDDDSFIDTNFYLNTVVPKITEILSNCKATVPLITGKKKKKIIIKNIIIIIIIEKFK